GSSTFQAPPPLAVSAAMYPSIASPSSSFVTVGVAVPAFGCSEGCSLGCSWASAPAQSAMAAATPRTMLRDTLSLMPFLLVPRSGPSPDVAIAEGELLGKLVEPDPVDLCVGIDEVVERRPFLFRVERYVAPAAQLDAVLVQRAEVIGHLV